MDAYNPSRLRQQAYIRKVMKARKSNGSGSSVTRFIKGGGALGADFIRHSIQMIGVIGLVCIAVGATTECQLYQNVLNWISSFF